MAPTKGGGGVIIVFWVAHQIFLTHPTTINWSLPNIIWIIEDTNLEESAK